jgi:hypothetical protein
METKKMAFQIGASRKDLSGPKPVPPGLYDLQVTGFKPKVSKNGESLNYNGEFTIIGNPEYDGRKIFSSLNTKFATGIRDMVHATGNEMELVQVLNPETNQMEEQYVLPGTFVGADAAPQNPESWGAYVGPLTNATFKAEVVTTVYLGKEKNEIKMYICTVPGCAEKDPDLRHSTNLVKN